METFHSTALHALNKDEVCSFLNSFKETCLIMQNLLTGLCGPKKTTLIIIIIIIIIIINCNWVVTRWQWLFYMRTKYEIGYY